MFLIVSNGGVDEGFRQEGQEQPQTEPNKEEAKAAEEKDEEVVDEKTRTLRAALSHVVHTICGALMQENVMFG